MSLSRWIELTNAKGIIVKNGSGGGTYAQRDRLVKLNAVAIQQMRVLAEVENRKLLK